MSAEEDPTTQELRVEQLQREAVEHDRAKGSPDEDEAEQHERRAEKAGYLREKLEERAEAERRAGQTDRTEGADQPDLPGQADRADQPDRAGRDD